MSRRLINWVYQELNIVTSNWWLKCQLIFGKSSLRYVSFQLSQRCYESISFIHYLFQNKVSDNMSNKTNQRAPQLINLGITNRKVDQLPRLTLTGRCGLNLISTSTQIMTLTKSSLKSIGKLLMYIINCCIPESPYPDIFKCTSSYENDYIT